MEGKRKDEDEEEEEEERRIGKGRRNIGRV